MYYRLQIKNVPIWKERKGPALSQYEPQSMMETECFKKTSVNMPVLSDDMKTFCLSKLLQAAPNSALSKHK
jgi:hypothetical protein